ncbi:MAG: diaminopimelate epimerase [Halioglobus sp.]|nr:diaminopimelate epimerase [Halioglobus sp.]
MSDDAVKYRTRHRAFVKMHGLRNHFVIVDVRQDPWSPGIDEIARIYDVQTGVGADQLILIEPSRSAAAFMRILNEDGREAEACGNATRCVAWLLLEESAADSVLLETRVGVLRCDRAGDRRVRCEMGKLNMDWRRIPLSEKRDTLHLGIGLDGLKDPVAVSVGNPHAVFFVDDIDCIDLKAIGPKLQKDPLFPQQVNIGVAQMLSAERMRLAVYERGAGLTMACGSGACAAVFAARARGLTSADSVTVSLPGGDMQIEIRADDMAIMTGPVAFSFLGEL